ncbi:MAG TPA: YdcH family protein [Acidobacteriota bacterium]|nr:YdcH family protein [Acidobacteriota bacterium]
MDESQVKEYLIHNDQEFRRLAEEHKNFERKLQELHQKPHRNANDQFEEITLKKKKLAIKDQMQLIISRYQAEHTTR